MTKEALDEALLWLKDRICEDPACGDLADRGSRWCVAHKPAEVLPVEVPLFDVPQQNPEVVARADDPGTSWEAARSVTTQQVGHRAIVRELTEFGPMSDQEIFKRLRMRGVKISESGARTRRKELERTGRVEDTGETILTDGGRKTKVWRVVAGGEAYE